MNRSQNSTTEKGLEEVNDEVLFTLVGESGEEATENSDLQIDKGDWELTDQYFRIHHEVALQSLLAQLDADLPCGPDLRESSLYSEILEARRADDPDLPRGDWVYDLKRADWKKVSQMASQALHKRSKDLQVTAWFMESEIRQRGFSAVGPMLTLFDLFLQKFWEDINPSQENLELRYNIFHWLDTRIALAINLVPILQNENDSKVITGVDIDRSLANERLLESGKIHDEQIEGFRWKHICQIADSDTNEFFQGLYIEINSALAAVGRLSARLDQVFADNSAPGLHTMLELLEKSMEFVCMQLDKRGLLSAMQNPVSNEQMPEKNDFGEYSEGNQESVNLEQAVQAFALDRHQAYEQLDYIADYLARIEPHSPVPYVLKRAVEWGRFNTAELYEELFVTNNGKLNLFEILGVENRQSDRSRE